MDVELNLDADEPKGTLDPLWPKQGHVYDCVVVILPNKKGNLVYGPAEILDYLKEVESDLAYITNIPLDDPGVFRAVLKYWARTSYSYGSGETDFDDGFYLDGGLVRLV